MSTGSDEELATLKARIQTITLVLSVVRPQAVYQSTYRCNKTDNKHIRTLDQMSLFFVSSTQGDAVAVSAAITPDTIELLLGADFGDAALFVVLTSQTLNQPVKSTTSNARMNLAATRISPSA
jgi:hypothetical protein